MGIIIRNQAIHTTKRNLPESWNNQSLLASVARMFRSVSLRQLCTCVRHFRVWYMPLAHSQTFIISRYTLWLMYYWMILEIFYTKTFMARKQQTIHLIW